MSVGHVARAFEEAGIATVCILVRAFRRLAERMRLPRFVVTRYPLGRPVGPPGAAGRQREVVRAALGLLDDAEAPGAVLELETPYLGAVQE